MAADSPAPIFGNANPAPTPDPPKRTWVQRLTIVGVFVAALGCFGASGVLFAAQRVVEDRNVVTIASPGQGDSDGGSFSSDAPGEATPPGDSLSTVETAPPETFPPAEPDARNFLITGADNNACISPDSPYAAAFGDRSDFGERSDTIMLWRVNPATSQVAVLSFPRDLWVTISGRSNSQRINTAYEPDQPQRLIDTIYDNFGIGVDHYVQVDFCAFKLLVDAVKGVAVPFEFPVRDPNTGLNVPTAGCYTFDGDHALAYVRSRKLEYLDVDGTWKKDGTSDLGRISRQQDFIRRTVDSLLAAGAFDPSVIRALIQTSDDYVTSDSNLSLKKMLEFAGVLKGIDPATITSYQIEAKNAKISGNSVLIPQLDGENMQAVLALFRGEATLAGTPAQVLASDATTPPSELATDTASDTSPDTAPGTSAAVDNTQEPVDSPAGTLPVVEAETNTKGIFPDPSVRCN